MDDGETAAAGTSSNNQHSDDIANSWTDGPSILSYSPSGQHQSTYRQLSVLLQRIPSQFLQAQHKSAYLA